MIDINDQPKLDKIFKDQKPDRVVHLAAQAGVRHSLKAPRDYIDSNVMGFLNVLEACRNFGTEHLIYASTSSIYGANTRMPFSEKDATNHPKSLYAATKRANELMAHSYSHLFNLPVTGLRFFTVYGPWGRPDMAPMIFADAILKGKPINIFNNGNMKRDFTYIDDIVEGVVCTLENIPNIDPNWDSNSPDPSTSGVAPYCLYNIGNNKAVELMKFIEALENNLGKKAKKNYLPIQPGDIHNSWANIESITKIANYDPKTSIENGVKLFVEWYLEYFNIRI